MKKRYLNENELLLIKCLLSTTNYHFDLEDQKVIEMNDGNMGSLYFINDENSKRIMGSCIAEKEFKDIDDVPILVALNIDTNNCLYELDIWKVDFSPLIKYPTC